MISKLMTGSILANFWIFVQEVAKINSQLKVNSLQFVRDQMLDSLEYNGTKQI